VAVGLALFLMNRRTQHLKSRFGPEYTRAVEDTGGRLKAESALREREKRVQALSIHALSSNDRSRYLAQWQKVQTQFVDDPRGSIAAADELLGDVMSTRGYPVADLEQRSADLTVDHPVVVENYRAAHAIAARPDQGEAATEDLRQAMIHYRALFDELVGEPAPLQAKAS